MLLCLVTANHHWQILSGYFAKQKGAVLCDVNNYWRWLRFMWLVMRCYCSLKRFVSVIYCIWYHYTLWTLLQRFHLFCLVKNYKLIVTHLHSLYYIEQNVLFNIHLFSGPHNRKPLVHTCLLMCWLVLLAGCIKMSVE